MNRGVWWATVYGIAKSQIQLNTMHKDTKITILFEKGDNIQP